MSVPRLIPGREQKLRHGDIMVNATVATNRERIVRVEDDVSALDERVNTLEKLHLEHMAKLDVLLKIGRAILAIAGATLGLELGIEGGIV